MVVDKKELAELAKNVFSNSQSSGLTDPDATN